MWGTWEEILHGSVWKRTCSSVDQSCKRAGPYQQAITKRIFGDKMCWREAFSCLLGSPPFPPPSGREARCPRKNSSLNWCNKRQLTLGGNIWYCRWLCSCHRHPAPQQQGDCWDLINNQSGEAENARSPVHNSQSHPGLLLLQLLWSPLAKRWQSAARG